VVECGQAGAATQGKGICTTRCWVMHVGWFQVIEGGGKQVVEEGALGVQVP
jgi:hypothetical protein